MNACLVNGLPGVTVGAADRGLHYGDGLFETLRLVGGRPRFRARHLARLAAGCARLGFAAPDPELLAAEIDAVAGGIDPAGVVKLIVTRGAGGRGYRPPPTPQPTRIVQGYPPPAYDATLWRDGVALRLCQTRLARNARLAGLKHLNRLEQVLARSEWDDPAIAEGLMLDDDGHAVCGTQTNLFALLGGRLVTPAVADCGVAGILRGFVLEQAARAGIACDVRPLAFAELAAAEELFVTNAVIGAWPVRSLDGCDYAPGPMARRCQQWLAEVRE